MARYEVASTSTLATATANAPLVGFRVTAAVRARILEIGITLTAATATQLQLVRATTVGASTITTAATGQNTEQLGAVAVGIVMNTMPATAPTLSATALRRIALPATVGAGVIWSWPLDRPLFVGPGNAIAELYIANAVAAAPSTFNYYFVWEE